MIRERVEVMSKYPCLKASYKHSELVLSAS